MRIKKRKKNFSPSALIRPSLAVFILCFLSHPAVGAEWEIVAKAAVLMEMQTGRILWAKNKELPRPPASTAKILTAFVTLDRVPLKEIVTVPIAAFTSTSSAIRLQVGERLAVHDLLYAVLLQSSNDAALALASHVGGTTPKFVHLMNQKARSLGALHSRFLNPTGLPQQGQVTTALDLALITKAALANSEFRRIVATKSYPWKSSEWEGVLENSNELLKSYDGAIGVKTGNTREAGHCLVAAAQRGDKALIAVILGSQEKHVWQDAKNLLDYGFKNSTDATPGGRPLTSG
ncbi:MAG TPA: D-alanyl-D-alanine carboxypeptidase family protein [Candidatus Binatia bacterium]|nr:D-alanyl-D-alanine carboxypeptidase family protein [Candidatus Binatia bacterium]